jgi:hypothetical protein
MLEVNFIFLSKFKVSVLNRCPYRAKLGPISRSRGRWVKSLIVFGLFPPSSRAAALDLHRKQGALDGRNPRSLSASTLGPPHDEAIQIPWKQPAQLIVSGSKYARNTGSYKKSTRANPAMTVLAQWMPKETTEAVPRGSACSDLDLLSVIKPLLINDKDAISKKRKPIKDTRPHPPVRRENAHERFGPPTRPPHPRTRPRPGTIPILRQLVPDPLHRGGAGTGRFGRQRGPRH